jgi:hypothetical protein
MQQVTAIAVLLKDEGARNTRPKPRELDVLQPDVAV